MNTWIYSDLKPDSRKQNLDAPTSFENIAGSIARSMKVQCGHYRECELQDGFYRITYCIIVDKTLFDLFFNSENGYRGSYFRSTQEGLRANKLLFETLTSALIESEFNDGASRDLIVKSLSTESAKSWLAEVGKGFCKKCHGEWTLPQDATVEIKNGRWENVTQQKSDAYWRCGRKAPFLTNIRIFGGFVNERGKEFVPPDKRHRAKQIHEIGWT